VTVSWFDVVVFTLSMVSAVTALAAFAWAARAGHPAMRQLYTVAAALTAVYAVSYVVVLSGMLVPAEWSKYLRPVSLLFWWVAVIAPTAGAVLVHRGTRAGLAEFVRAVHDG
jgi:hypothetical protein